MRSNLPQAKTISLLRLSMLFRPRRKVPQGFMVESSGTAPESNTLIPNRVYRHSSEEHEHYNKISLKMQYPPENR